MKGLRKWSVVVLGMVLGVMLAAYNRLTPDAAKILITGMGFFCGANYLKSNPITITRGPKECLDDGQA